MINVNFDEATSSKVHYNGQDYAWAGYFEPITGQGQIVTAESHEKLIGTWNIEFGQDRQYRIDSRIQNNNVTEPEYFLCFYPGTQGRFINQVLRSLLENNFAGITECRAGFNSWHRPRNSTVNAIVTHHYPNWSVVKSKDYLNQNKFIIIKFDYDDVAEIHGNTVYKNIIQDLALYPEQHKNFNLDRPYKIFQQLYGNCSIENFVKIFTTDYDKLQTVIKFEIDNYLLNFDNPDLTINTKYIAAAVDEDFKSQTLIINFKDIYNTSSTGFVALDKICDFFKIPVAEDAVKLFNFNAISRANLIKKYLYKLDIR